MSDISHVEGLGWRVWPETGCGLSVNAGAINVMAGIRTKRRQAGPVGNTVGISALRPSIAVALARGKIRGRLALTLKVHTIISSKNFRKNRPGLRHQDLQPAAGPL